jgi:uncharacterized protein YuzE
MLKYSIKPSSKISNFYYDKEHDLLSIFLKNNIQPTTTDEPFDDIYFFINETKNIITSIEIWHFSKRNINVLKKKIPINFDFSTVLA